MSHPYLPAGIPGSLINPSALANPLHAASAAPAAAHDDQVESDAASALGHRVGMGGPILAPFPVLPTPAKAVVPVVSASRRFFAGLGRLATSRYSLVSMAGLFLGLCLAAYDGPLAWPAVALTVAGLCCLEVARSASGEVYDFDSGADGMIGRDDRSPFSGGQRLLADGLLTRGQIIAVAAVGYGLCAAAGVAIAWLYEPAVLWLGVAGILLAFFHPAPPFKWADRGWGELAVALVYGPGIVVGAYLVQRGEITLPAVLVSLPLGVLVAAFFWINEFPDGGPNQPAGQCNLVVRLGRRRASRVFAAGVILAQIGIGLLPLAGLPLTVLMGAASGVPLAIATQILLAHPDHSRRLIPAQALTLVAILLFALAAGLGIVLAP